MVSRPRRRLGRLRAETSSRSVESQLRVIGGKLRGRTIPYCEESGLRPMKDRVREAVFNLIGPRVVGKHVLDLFAGTGAVSFEALSRGAARANLFERKFPTARRIEEAATELGLRDRIEVSAGDAFVWARQFHPANATPLLVFCCPPYELFVSRQSDVHRLLLHLWDAAPASSVFVVESDRRFDPSQRLPFAGWIVRNYPPAVIGIAEKPLADPQASGGLGGGDP